MNDLSAPPRWNLADLYDGIEDARIAADLVECEARARQFEERYREALLSRDLSAAVLLEAIQEYEAILQRSDKAESFAGLVYSADASDPRHGALVQKIQEAMTEIRLHFIFFDLAILKMPSDLALHLIEDPALASYRHYLETLRAFSGHDLTEPEERIMEEMANTGSRAFSRLFEEITSNATFKLEWEGETQTLSQSELLALMFRPERELRREAARSFSAGLTENLRTVAFIFNTLVQDKAVEDRLRQFSEPEESRHLANELDAETVETVMRTCEEHYGLVKRYYLVKKEILGLKTLTHYDRYAPLMDAEEEVSFSVARAKVLDAFGGFSPTMRDHAERFFEGNWIDAETRPGKRGGAFCSYVTPDLHPYVLMNFVSRMDDVMTLAHELGHGVHAYLSRQRSFFNYHGTLPMAELASTFAEMLVFEKLQSEASLKDRMALCAQKIEGTFATIFRQATMFRFEQKLHRARRERGELTPEAIGEIWQECIQAMFQDSVELGEEHRMWWSYIPHFVHSPFYVYAYSFGELLVLSLYRMYQREGDSFAERYVEMLRLGGSRSPREMMERMGIDLRSPEFWKGGMEAVEALIVRFEEDCQRVKESA